MDVFVSSLILIQCKFSGTDKLIPSYIACLTVLYFQQAGSKSDKVVNLIYS